MMSIQWTVKLEDADKLRQYLEEGLNIALWAAANRIQQELVHLTPRDKYGRGKGPGRLQESFTATPDNSGILLSWGAAHAQFPDEGVPKHIMRDDVGISTPYGVFKKIKHPGQEPQNYRFNTGQAAQEILKEEIRKALLAVQVKLG